MLRQGKFEILWDDVNPVEKSSDLTVFAVAWIKRYFAHPERIQIRRFEVHP